MSAELAVLGGALAAWAALVALLALFWRARLERSRFPGTLALLERPRSRFGALHGRARGLDLALELGPPARTPRAGPVELLEVRAWVDAPLPSVRVAARAATRGPDPLRGDVFEGVFRVRPPELSLSPAARRLLLELAAPPREVAGEDLPAVDDTVSLAAGPGEVRLRCSIGATADADRRATQAVTALLDLVPELREHPARVAAPRSAGGVVRLCAALCGPLLFGAILVGSAREARWISGVEGLVVGREVERARRGYAHYLLVTTPGEERVRVRVPAAAYRACPDGSPLRRVPGSFAIECGGARYVHLTLGVALVVGGALAAFVVAVGSATLAAALYRGVVVRGSRRRLTGSDSR